ncbi:gamma-glutamyl-gamma-aminobutyrate hydrolase family protein [Acidovorax sp. NCPPB 3576]|uniref:gamma-glutamyl-gamma-aminobutyrate hydrolase family protein n=1 Tax=Acidovorax sp. NCPPB 3576 TaxID=2940488 RepID=UPI00234BAB8D|nr:gamma-glutamyl-gamma-aminobutyrate hydrolase family protein [Acidovorax sp. NCPPB 3576]WCM88337.1 gamma-glutamyl-gamma-aminobutyrate hydrolase family protein [Acidovorax sp. NCPPB 3576]
MKVSVNAADVKHRQSESTGGDGAPAVSKGGPAAAGPSGHPDLPARQARSFGAEALRSRAPLSALPVNAGLAAPQSAPLDVGAADTALLQQILKAGASQPAGTAGSGKPSLAAALAAAGHSHVLEGARLAEGGPALRGWDLSGVDFKRCRFDASSLADTHIEGSRFESCRFESVSLANASLRNTAFKRCEFEETMFLHAALSGVRFEDSELHHCSFEDAQLTGDCVFTGVKMPGTHFLCASVAEGTRIEASATKGPSDLTDTVFLGTKGRFIIDAVSDATAGLTRPTTATLVSHESRGITVPRVGAKLAAVAGTLPLRVEMRAASLQAKDVDAEVDKHLKKLASQPGSDQSLPQRLVIDALANPEALPKIAQILAKAEILARHVDSVVLPGGEDVSPHLYGQTPEPKTDWSGDYRRSVLEMGLLHQCFHHGVPLMAICRGFQMTNVFFGAALQQHVGHQVGVRTLDNDRGEEAGQAQATEGAENGVGVFGNALQDIRAAVYHHQAVIDPPEGRPHLSTSLRRTIPSEGGETAWRAIMAVESSQPRAPLIGLQFHPEFFDGSTARGGEARPLSNTELEQLGAGYTRPGAQTSGLQNPADLIASGILDHMSPGNDALWKILSDAATAHRHKASITAEALVEGRAKLRPAEPAMEPAIG